MKAFIRYLISSNIGEVACIFLVAALGFPEAMVPVQLLWVNLVTDGLPATALTMNPPDSNVMNCPPRPLSEAMVDAWLFTRYMLVGLYVGVATVIGHGAWFIGGYHGEATPISFHDLSHFEACGHDGWPAGVGGANCEVFHSLRPRTVALSILVTIEMLNALNALSQNESLLCAPTRPHAHTPHPHMRVPTPPRGSPDVLSSLARAPRSTFPPWRNPWLLGAIALSMGQHLMILYVPFFHSVFGVAALTWDEWVLVLYVSVPVILLDEVLKLITRLRDPTRKGASVTSKAALSIGHGEKAV